MEFYTAFSEKRPKRLCEATRFFAYDSLYNHKYGQLARSTPCINIYSSEDGFSELSLLKKYDRAIREIVSNAPVRISEGEMISLSATLGDSIDHWVPVTVDREHIFLGISHLTIGFSRVLQVGINGIKKEAIESLSNCADEKREFLESAISSIESFELWIKRYITALKEKGYDKNAENLSKVPFSPPKNFLEAVQSIWAVFAFCRLCGNWPGIGRIDTLLGKYLENDLENGILTIIEAREILAHFFIKGCEWITGTPCESGDAQHYQNIVLGGCDEHGTDVTNEVTYLVLDIVEELGISDFPISVRIGKNTPEKLIRRVAEVMRYGNGVIAIYNEDTVIEALQNNGYTLSESREFANDGCWEVMLPGKTYFTYHPFDSLALLQKKTLNNYSEDIEFSSFEELYGGYISDLRIEVSGIHKNCENKLKNKGKLSYEWNDSVPCTVISLFEDSCIKKGISYTDGGTDYYVYSPHLGGLADTANSLYALKKLVFDEKKVSFSEFVDILSRNWENAEDLRHYALNSLEYYGNDNDEVDIIVSRILSDFADICNELEKTNSFRFPAGVSTFGRQIGWRDYRLALPCGQPAKSVLANNMTPTPQTAFKGPTAIINSYCKADLSRISNGAALDIRIMPNDVQGEDGISALTSLIKAFCVQGGFFMQIDVADSSILRKAQESPEDYPALAVRVAGWNARFVTLSSEWQDMIISNLER